MSDDVPSVRPNWGTGGVRASRRRDLPGWLLPAELSQLKVRAETDPLTRAANRLYPSTQIKELLEQGESFGLRHRR
jgi:hypothetical protein